MNVHGYAPDLHDLSDGAGPAPEPAAGGRRRLKAADLAAGALLAALSVAVVVNALVFQGPGGAVPVPPKRPAADAAADKAKPAKTVAAAPAAPAPAPAQPAPTGGATDGSLGYLVMRTTGAPPAPPTAPGGSTAARAPSETVRRPLAAVGSAPSPEVTGAVRPPAELPANGRVLSVQKALARLGYGPLKVDGRPGTETRLAIQRFQRDRNLPADGEMSDRLVRELSVVTGTAVN